MTTTTFNEYLDATKSTVDVMDALKYLADCHPTFKDNAILQNITSGKVNPTDADLSAIARAGYAYAIYIAHKSLKLTPNQQTQIAAEVAMLTSAVGVLNSVRLQMLMEAVSTISELAAIRRYTQGQIE